MPTQQCQRLLKRLTVTMQRSVKVNTNHESRLFRIQFRGIADQVAIENQITDHCNAFHFLCYDR
ncbi:MAG: hypothetical protein CMJ64_05400 [Planctomycetaceae bacterium]|nr:hypothetical protein [Planctomycetaceae bacterium]